MLFKVGLQVESNQPTARPKAVPSQYHAEDAATAGLKYVAFSTMRTFSKIVHWMITLSPLIILWSIKTYAGPVAAMASVGCALVYLYCCVIFSPRRPAQCLKVKGNRTEKKNVAVIGAGPCGLVTAKELLDRGHKVTCFDKDTKIGGVFANGFYPGGRLTSSPYVTAFSDFEPPRDPDGRMHYFHYAKPEYVQYLNQYSDHFGVTKTLRLGHEVVHVQQDRETRKFTVMTERVDEKGETVKEDHGPYDHVAFSTGLFGPGRRKMPDTIPGISDFTGKVVHVSDFGGTDDPEEAYKEMSGKRVLAIGLGESMGDILGLWFTMLKKPPTYCAASVRGGVFVIPRTNPLTGINNDFDTTRLRYWLPKPIHNAAWVVCSYLTNLFDFGCGCPRSQVRFNLFRRLPFNPAYVRTTKSDLFVDAVINKDVNIKPGITKFDGRDVHFTDGSVVRDIDVVVCGTGYGGHGGAVRMPWLNGKSLWSADGKSNVMACDAPGTQFLRMFDPRMGSEIGYVGFVRPLIGSIPTIAEMQARMFATVVNGDRVLPSEKVMTARMDRDNAEFVTDFADIKCGGWKGLTNWIPYMDLLANEMGCNPKRHWLFTRPGLWLKLLTGPMSTFHYRLVGLDAKPENALSVIWRLPYGARPQDTLFFAGLHFSVALVYWPIGFVGAFMDSVRKIVS